MIKKISNRNLFKPDTETILVRGLNGMTQANEALQNQNELLTVEIETLKTKISILQERLLENPEERE
jgi:hypothetical protein